MSTPTNSAAKLLDKERSDHSDHLTLAACVVGELHALLNALALMRGKPGTDDDLRRLIGIGQNIGADCHRPAHRSHLMIGTMEPGRDRHIGATP